MVVIVGSEEKMRKCKGVEGEEGKGEREKEEVLGEGVDRERDLEREMI